MFRNRLIASVALMTLVSRAGAVVLYETATRNTTAPTGAYAGSGWQYQGVFGGFLGTPVAPQFFVTAAHVGGPAPLVYNGTTYPIDTTFIGSTPGSGPGFAEDPDSDLRLWKIQGTFPTFAPLFDPAIDGSEIGRQLVVIGRGAARGAEVRGRFAGPPRDGSDPTPIPGPGGDVKPRDVRELKGWEWGVLDGVQAWGTNTVDGFVSGGPPFGPLLAFDFDRAGTIFESALSAGDSGGGVFVQGAGNVWKLAGINLSVDGPFATSLERPAFHATIFDMGGLYVDQPPQFIEDQSFDIPGSAYSTSVSAHLPWIRSVTGLSMIDIPEPSLTVVVALISLPLARPRRRA
jgi:hypothetical protein